MKKQFLNLGKALNKAEQKQIFGGKMFECYCGFVGGQWEGQTFEVRAGSIGNALNEAGDACGGYGATCEG